VRIRKRQNKRFATDLRLSNVRGITADLIDVLTMPEIVGL